MTVSVLRLFLTMLWVGLQCVIVVFPDHTTFRNNYMYSPPPLIKFRNDELGHNCIQIFNLGDISSDIRSEKFYGDALAKP